MTELRFIPRKVMPDLVMYTPPGPLSSAFSWQSPGPARIQSPGRAALTADWMVWYRAGPAIERPDQQDPRAGPPARALRGCGDIRPGRAS
jgi:hypothetical protein